MPSKQITLMDRRMDLVANHTIWDILLPGVKEVCCVVDGRQISAIFECVIKCLLSNLLQPIAKNQGSQPRAIHH